MTKYQKNKKIRCALTYTIQGRGNKLPFPPSPFHFPPISHYLDLKPKRGLGEGRGISLYTTHLENQG